ncbi:GNAT family N-acetyltransferase [Lacticigenium naphthae]|uniref:GNAT family N-acetyltransferase n=1 Tax=Lacticigenium naphthae TaxID=515351 RepID=UPI0003FC07EE|nr:GNAT family N-acetyltransferase [Lacticigenium naphthae]
MIRKCTKTDIQELQAISRQTFVETFGTQNTPEDLQHYLQEAFHIKNVEKEWTNPNSVFYFIYIYEKLAGYLKLNQDEAQTESYGTETMEVERIYVLKEFKGKGSGKKLLEKAEEVAHQQNKNKIWLGVWEHNDKAIEFYKKRGYQKIDEHIFQLGEDKQTDFIFMKKLKIDEGGTA